MNKDIPFYADLLSQDFYSQAGIIRSALESDLHVHSNFSDGFNTPEEIIRRAIAKGYKCIAVVDHVRRTTDWLDKFALEMARLKKVYSGEIGLFSGIEAKVINLEGDVDARPEFFAKVDLVLSAFHRIPKGQDEFLKDDEIINDKDKALELWLKAKMRLLENPHVRIVAHPTAILTRHNVSIPHEVKNAVAQKAALYGKVFEVNLKYKVPDPEFIQLLQNHNVRLSVGTDSHGIEEM